ncbi:hypothetical protein [Devosia sp. CN2-171]|uniref:hypothetical protein n=1 Tax=Devosia sp. CN2-171 TaxID=3400909 RepID=UPI003BF82E68
MKITYPGLVRCTGLAAILAGAIFAGIQPIHPPDMLASVTTGNWAIIISLKLAMCLLFLVGIAGLYLRQAERTGWLGLAGFLLLTVSFWLQTAFVFAELFILPVVAASTPAFVDSYLGVVNGSPGEMDIGALVPTYGVVGLCYVLGGLLFGIAAVRAGILPRLPAMVLAIAAIITPAAAFLPHEIQRFAAVPMGLALGWLGWALWSERAKARSSGTSAPLI